ncbi:MAG: polysaccharide deacetylase family protein [Deltaproteobacteria bacterium]|nr:polysaccharide deacetylase family protein [Deltaproteobacteria bacterium]
MLETTRYENIRSIKNKIFTFIFNLLFHARLTKMLKRPGIAIMCYHRIIPDNQKQIASTISVTQNSLRRQIRFYKKYFKVISLEKAVELLRNHQVDQPYLVITFDDGYKDNYTLGLDIFLSENVEPTVFVTTDCVDKQENLWPDDVRNALYNAQFLDPVSLTDPKITIKPDWYNRICAVERIIDFLKNYDANSRSQYLERLRDRFKTSNCQDSLMLNWDEVRMLSNNRTHIGSHTVSHTILGHLPEKDALQELEISKNILEDQLNAPVKTFAYPNGKISDFNEVSIDLLKKTGYECAVTTIRGINSNGADLFRLHRTMVYFPDNLYEIKYRLAYEARFCD